MPTWRLTRAATLWPPDLPGQRRSGEHELQRPPVLLRPLRRPEMERSSTSQSGRTAMGVGTGLVGGGSVDPQDPNVVYISPPIDPRDQSELAKHEIFRGVTSDGGDTWSGRQSREIHRPIIYARWSRDGIPTALPSSGSAAPCEEARTMTLRLSESSSRAPSSVPAARTFSFLSKCEAVLAPARLLLLGSYALAGHWQNWTRYDSNRTPVRCWPSPSRWLFLWLNSPPTIYCHWPSKGTKRHWASCYRFIAATWGSWRSQIWRRLQGKADPSDIVRDALVEAHERFDRFRGSTEVEFAAWLRSISPA